MKNKISLIGMPSAGKSTFSHELATKLGYRFMDLDHMVEEKEDRDLISILNEKGGPYFLNIEYEFLLAIPDIYTVVISTAGSIIYHEKAMEWLKQNTTIIYIDTPLDIIEKRLSEKPKAVVGLKEKGLAKLAEERIPVYTKYADFIVSTKDKTSSEVIDEIIAKLKS